MLKGKMECMSAIDIHTEAYGEILDVAKKDAPGLYPALLVEQCFNKYGLEISDTKKKQVTFPKAVAIQKCYLEIYSEFPELADDIFSHKVLNFEKNMDWDLIKSEKKVTLWEVFTPELSGYIVAIGFGKKKPDEDSLNKFRKTASGKKTAWRTAWTFDGQDRKGAEKFFDVQVSRDNYYF